jgi:prepilin-type N-terminal cleavage/methylation domain-containing protein/prepilin-type processing-associated H-X9-DG protein
MRTRGACLRDGGFTLIELLCVIAIISILMGLAMPVYSNFRDKSDGVKCSSNLRQIGAALQGYVGANDGQFPEIETDPNNPVYPPDSQAKGLLPSLQGYGLTEDVVKCPADLRIPAFNYFAKRGTSYEWAPYVDDELETAPQIFTRRGQLTMPISKIIVCFDTERVHGLKGDYVSKKNYLYADGHVRNYWDTAPRAKPKN